MYDIGDSIGSYRVIDELGSGGFGTVLLVEHMVSRKKRALKYCTTVNKEARRRFSREVRAMEKVQHANVVKVLKYDLDHDPPYFIMPVAKGSLEKEISTFAANHVAALEAFLQLCAGVVAVHASAGPHRDLKPHNALRMPDGTVVVSDFGLIKIAPRDTTVLTRTTQVLGTNLYMAPEQRLLGGTRDADPLVDVYALGATLYHFVTGKFPAVIDPVGVPPSLAKIIKRATAHIPSERYPNVEKLTHAVKRYLELLRSPKDPIGTYAERLDTVKKRLENSGKYNLGEVSELLSAVHGLLEDHSTLIEEFDRIPDVVLEKAAKRLPEELADALDAYVKALDGVVAGREWPYAEEVAARMRRVFDYTGISTLKATAIEATLVAAADLHRFAAMDSLEEMLCAVTSDEDAEAIADVLRDQEMRVRVVAPRYKNTHMHHVLREVLREIEATEKNESSSATSSLF